MITALICVTGILLLSAFVSQVIVESVAANVDRRAQRIIDRISSIEQRLDDLGNDPDLVQISPS